MTDLKTQAQAIIELAKKIDASKAIKAYPKSYVILGTVHNGDAYSKEDKRRYWPVYHGDLK